MAIQGDKGMAPNELAAQTAAQSQGAVFHRCALQVNPHQYAGKFRGQEASGDPQSHANAVVEKAEELGISVLAITDHNSVSGVTLFQDAATGRGIVIFPGFELSSLEGVHVLCIYPPGTLEGQLNRFLGEFGVRSPTSSSDPSDKPFLEVLAKTREQGGVAIAAHATSVTGGLFEILSGQPRIKAWRSEDLLAIQIPGSVDDLPQDVRQIILNKNPDYQRTPAGKNLGIAIVNAKDIVRPEDLADRSATCWIKMSEISIEGLRQAFLDPESRIRLASDKPLEDHAELLSLSWEGGFLDGAAIRFNQNLNVLVGGRGTGKSTILESLRYALDLRPVGDAARVPKMREEKRRRQFIFSTHNANIPVLGDAEMIVGLAASGEAEGGSVRIAPEHVGAIDALPVRELIEEVLEGGKDAFERHRRKYGF